MLICKNCKYFAPDREWPSRYDQMQHGFCTHPNAMIAVSYHQGHVYNKRADTCRKDSRGCGRDARYYIDKDSIDPPKINHMVFCTSCKYQKQNTNYYVTYDQNEYAFCTHPLSHKIDMVTGEITYPFASQMRNEKPKDEIRSCGINGYMYEERVEEETTGNKHANADSEFGRMITIAVILLLFLL